ncbi:MAG: PAS domain S-box protein [Verrucomicrobia bacterium]|nr:PAS domain S-box protein [Verrucomicrobiota bacterium]
MNPDAQSVGPPGELPSAWRRIWSRLRGGEARWAERARLAAIVESSDDAIIAKSLDGIITAWNAGAERLLGYRSEEMIGRSIILLFPPDRRGEEEAIMVRILRGERVQHFETVRLRKDGSAVEVDVTISPILGPDGRVVGASKIARDITVRKQAERKIHEQAELLDKANEAIVAFDLAGSITFWSRGAERLLGWTSAEMLGQPVAQVLARSGVDPQAEVFQALARGGDWRGVISGRTRSGEPMTIETSVTEVRDREGRPIGRLSISTDITAQAQLQEQFLRTQRLESVGLLAAGIAHDFNNVLTPIAMAVPVLRGHLTTPAHQRLITTVGQCVDRGAGLVQQILGFAQGVGGERRLVQVRHLLRDIVGVVVETFPKSIVIEDRVAPDLWPVLAQPTQIHQVALNLCINARDAMPAGGRLRVQAENRMVGDGTAQAPAAGGKIEGMKPGAWVVLTVEDTGTGIAADVLDRIWEPFFTTKGPGKGSGLGLATVRTIIETHQGFVTVDSVPGHSSTFRVYLPAAEGTGQHHDPAPARAAVRGHGERILLVDDEAHVRDLAEAILTDACYRVVTAADGAAAATRFRAEADAFALVVTDQDMPNLDGISLARLIRKSGGRTRILAISGTGSDPTRGPRNDYADALLPKPFTADALLRAVADLLAKPAAPS